MCQAILLECSILKFQKALSQSGLDEPKHSKINKSSMNH